MAFLMNTGRMCHGFGTEKGVHVSLYKGCVLSQLPQERTTPQRKLTLASTCGEPARCLPARSFEGIKALASIGHVKTRRRSGMRCEWIRRAKCRACVPPSSHANLIDRLLGNSVKLNFEGTSKSDLLRVCFLGFLGLGDYSWKRRSRTRGGTGVVSNLLFGSGYRRPVSSLQRNSAASLRRTSGWIGSSPNKVGLKNSMQTCEASKKGNNNPQPTPPEEEPEPKKEGDATRSSFPRPSLVPETDWRLVRARLVAGEQATSINGPGTEVHVGGPLDTNKFLLLHATPGVKNFREVIPGVYYGSPDGLEPSAEMMRTKNTLPQDLRFFFGYSGWGTEQLNKEISMGLWHVAACSTDLITGVSNAGLWEEILLLMGGKYAELSKRPRRKM